MGRKCVGCYVAPTGDAYRRMGHACAYQRGYYDGLRGIEWPAESVRERRGHRAAYGCGYRLGVQNREQLVG